MPAAAAARRLSSRKRRRTGSREVVDAEWTGTFDEAYSTSDGRYSGQVNASARHGQGKMQYHSGDSFEGEWVGDLRHGHGTFTHASNGDTYVGQWVRGCKEGFGVFCYSEGGFKYQGNWAGGSFCGQGTMTQHAGEKLEDANEGKVLARGIWPSGPWVEGLWDTCYPRPGAEGTIVTARKSTGPPCPRPAGRQ